MGFKIAQLVCCRAEMLTHVYLLKTHFLYMLATQKSVLSHGDMFQGPQWVPETAYSIKPNVHCFFFSHIDIPMIKLNLLIKFTVPN